MKAVFLFLFLAGYSGYQYALAIDLRRREPDTSWCTLFKEYAPGVLLTTGGIVGLLGVPLTQELPMEYQLNTPQVFLGYTASLVSISVGWRSLKHTYKNRQRRELMLY